MDSTIYINRTAGKLMLLGAALMIVWMQFFIAQGDVGGQLPALVAVVVLFLAATIATKLGTKRAALLTLLIAAKDNARADFAQVFVRCAKAWVTALTTIFVLAKKTGDYINLMIRAIIKSALRVAALTLTPKLLPLPQTARA